MPFEDHGPPLLTEMIALCEEAQRWHTHPSFPLFCFFFFRLTLLLAPGGGFSRSGLFVSPFLGGFACLSGLVWLYDTRSVRDYSIHPLSLLLSLSRLLVPIIF